MGDIFGQATDFIRHPILSLTLASILILYSSYAKRGQGRAPKLPLGFFILFLLFRTIQPYASQPNWPAFESFIRVGGIICLWFGVIRIAAFILVDHVIGRRKAIAVPGITRDLILVILYIIVVMVILREELHIDVTSLIATSAILTAVIGLALQETLGNLFSGLALNVEKPYKIGDWVLFDKYRGQVRGISWRSTTVVTPENETIVVPNNVISRSHIVNYSDPSTHIVSGFFVAVAYDTPPNKLRDLIFITLRNHPEVLSAKEMEVRLIDFGDHAIKYEIRYWIDISNSYEDTDRIKSELMTKLWYSLRRAGVRIPYPIRVQYQAKEPTIEEVSANVEAALAKIDLFSPLTPAERHLLAVSVDTQEYSEGDIIVKQGDSGDCMYVIADGTCQVSVEGPRKTAINIATLSKGEFFGEMSLMTGDNRNATITAQTDAVLYRVEKNDLVKLIESNPAITATISEVLAKRLGERASAIETADTTEIIKNPPTANQILQKIRSFFRIT